MKKQLKPTSDEMKTELDLCTRPQFEGGFSDVRELSSHNHLIFEAANSAWPQPRVIRMINPESSRRNEFLPIKHEFQLLEALGKTDIVPKVYLLNDRFRVPFMVMEWIKGKALTDTDVGREYLRKVAFAVARLHNTGVAEQDLPFLKKYRRKGFRGRRLAWCANVAAALWKLQSKETMRWADQTLELLRQTSSILKDGASLFDDEPYVLHFDGAHKGNVFVRDNGGIVFLDAWERVSVRNDPTFTLVRFASSFDDADRAWGYLKVLIDEYCGIKGRKNTPVRRMAEYRLLERFMSDLAWTLRHQATEEKLEDEKLEMRIRNVKTMLMHFD